MDRASADIDGVEQDLTLEPSPDETGPEPNPPPPDHLQLPRKWIVAGVASLALATMIAAIGSQIMPFWLSGAAALAIGSWLFVATVPRDWVAAVNDEREAMRQFTERVGSVDMSSRTEPLNDLSLDRDDALGDLSRAVATCLARAAAFRAEARMLHRNMRDVIDRRTRQATAKLQRETTTDALTGVGNRRLLERLKPQWNGAIASTRSDMVAAMMIDIDLFKAINDTVGHEAGDMCLVFLADLLKSTLRRDEQVIRMGGDEFLVLMRGYSAEDARAVAERVQSLFSQMPWSTAQIDQPTLSIGIADAVLTHPRAVEQLLRKADAALYQAKQAGRAQAIVIPAA